MPLSYQYLAKLLIITCGLLIAEIYALNVHSRDLVLTQNHQQLTTSNDPQTFLKVASKINPNQTVKLIIEVKDKNGKYINNFEPVKQHLMQLIIISGDLQYFQHLYPKFLGNGIFEITTSFPQGGGYYLYSSYQPTGKFEQISVNKLEVKGLPFPRKPINTSLTKTYDNTTISLTSDTPLLPSQKPVNLVFNFKDSKTKQPIDNLQSFYIVIMREASVLKVSDYVKGEVIANNSLQTGKVSIVTKFPQSGNYKIWIQFNCNGKIVTADFFVNVYKFEH